MKNELTTTHKSNYVDSILIWFITLCSLKFYTLFVPETFGKAIILFGVLLVPGLLIVHFVYGKSISSRKHFIIEIILIFTAFFVSTIAARYFHSQSIMTTIFAQYEFYVFLFYFLIHRMKPDPDKLLTMFIWLGYIYAIIYIVQYLLYPTQIVNSKILADRNTVRIMMPGAGYMITAWFILLSRYFRTKQIINIIGLIPFVLVIILLGTRQIMATTALLTLLNILMSRTIKSKIFTYALIALAIVPFYFLFQGVFDQIIAVSHKESSSIQNNIRFLAARYFLFDLNDNPLWILTGNGMPGPHSDYGRFLYRISDQLGYFQSDVGIIGDFSKFGILFALAEIVFLIKMALCKCREKYSFIRYNALMILMSMFTGAGLGAAMIVQICFMLYITDTEKHYYSNHK
ncbi:MAG: hypothetical protein JXK95_00170 [Bacteroidales bacterium]|nr:hypothetical protein [Bacteroidales bacterium]